MIFIFEKKYLEGRESKAVVVGKREGGRGESRSVHTERESAD